MNSREGNALYAQLQQGQRRNQHRQQEAGGIWCDSHKTGTHSNAQSAAQGRTQPKLFFSKRKGKTDTAETITLSQCQRLRLTSPAPIVSAQLAKYSFDGSAFNTYVNNAADKDRLSLNLAHLIIWSIPLHC